MRPVHPRQQGALLGRGRRRGGRDQRGDRRGGARPDRGRVRGAAGASSRVEEALAPDAPAIHDNGLEGNLVVRPGAGQARRRRARLRRGRPRHRGHLRDGPPDAGLHGAQRLRLPMGRRRQADRLDLDADAVHGARHPGRGARRCRSPRCACWSTTWAAASAPSRTCSRPSSCARCWRSETRRPVRMEYTRKETFLGGRSRHPGKVWLKQGFKKDGTITARQARVVFNSGAYGSHGARRDRGRHLRADLALPLRERASRRPLRLHQHARSPAPSAATAWCRPTTRSTSRWTRRPRSSAWTRPSSS